tara:strand:- start:24 stop:440 length:417 start_codon:yes stop_codon:yes gene_type:complete
MKLSSDINFFFKFFFIFIIFQIIFNIAKAVEPEEFLQDPKQELRARDIAKNIRCLVCQNQSIDESLTPLAKDLRIVIRKKISDNWTDKEIYKYLTDRYGDFILLKPALKVNTILVWILPFLLFLIGLLIIYKNIKKSK